VAAADQDAGLSDGRHLGQVVLVVPVVAQQREGQAGVADDLLGGLVLRGDVQRRGVRVRRAGVGDMTDAALLGGVDHIGMLPYALAEFVA
jgi:hypothetical protein